MTPVPDADPTKTYPPTHVFYVVDSDGVPSGSKFYLHLAAAQLSAKPTEK